MVTGAKIETWIPLVEFSVKKGISLSTLRRYIKANKIKWKLHDGRYLILDDGSATLNIDVELRFKNLEKDLQNAQEEIAELKTLIAFYEEKWSQNKK
jgi:hypothetical protein